MAGGFRVAFRHAEKPGAVLLWRRLLLAAVALGAVAAVTTVLVDINVPGDGNDDTQPAAGITRTIAAHTIPLMHHFVNRSGCPDLGLSTEAADPHYERANKPPEIFDMKVCSCKQTVHCANIQPRASGLELIPGRDRRAAKPDGVSPRRSSYALRGTCRSSKILQIMANGLPSNSPPNQINASEAPLLCSRPFFLDFRSGL